MITDSSVASPICQEEQSERTFPIFAFFSPDVSLFFQIFPDFLPIFSKGHRKIANKARPQYFTDKHDVTIWSKYYVLHISNHVYELVKSTKNVFIAQEKQMLKKS